MCTTRKYVEIKMNCKICGKEINEEFQKCNNIGYGSYSTIYLVCNANKPKYVYWFFLPQLQFHQD